MLSATAMPLSLSICISSWSCRAVPCVYELTKKPELGGRIMVQFTIAASGQVIASVLQNSTMGNARVENCTVQAVRRWEFPKPLGGGIVIVSYPFVLTPAGGGE